MKIVPLSFLSLFEKVGDLKCSCFTMFSFVIPANAEKKWLPNKGSRVTGKARLNFYMMIGK